MLFVYLVLQACLDPDCAKSKLKSISNEISPILLGLIVTYLPWVLAKQLYGPESSGRLLYFQILCDKTAEASNQSFTTALLVYLKENPISEIILIRLENLLYPFDVTHPAAQFKQYWMSPLKLVKSISQLAFYQYIFVIGVPVFIAAMVSLVGRFRKEEVFFNKLFLISLSAVLPAAIAFGCPLSSWAHVWAFPAVLGSVAAAGFVLSHRGFGFVILFAAALLNNILFLHSEIYRKRFIPVASSTDLAYQLFPLAICLLLLSYMYFSPNLKEGNE